MDEWLGDFLKNPPRYSDLSQNDLVILAGPKTQPRSFKEIRSAAWGTAMAPSTGGFSPFLMSVWLWLTLHLALCVGIPHTCLLSSIKTCGSIDLDDASFSCRHHGVFFKSLTNMILKTLKSVFHLVFSDPTSPPVSATPAWPQSKIGELKRLFQSF